MFQRVFFVSKDANWQLYRNEVLTKLAIKHRFQIEVLTTGEIKSYLSGNAYLKYKSFTNIFPKNSKPSFFPGALWYIIKEKPDFILALSNATQLTEYIALLICRLLKIKYVVWTHAYDHNPINNNLKRVVKDVYTNFLFKMSNSIITFSQAGKDYLIRKGIDHRKIFVAPNTLDTQRVNNIIKEISCEFDKYAFLKSINTRFNKESKVVIFSGRLDKKKKVENLILALNESLKFKSNIHLLIIGDGDEKQNLIRLVNELGIKDFVDFIGAVYEEISVAKYFLVSDLCIIPSYVGLAIVHAFCFGLPFITERSDNHGPEIQFLKDGYNGYFVEEDNIAELSRKLMHVLFDKSDQDKLKENALLTIKMEASIDLMIDNMKEAIKY